MQTAARTRVHVRLAAIERPDANQWTLTRESLDDLKSVRTLVGEIRVTFSEDGRAPQRPAPRNRSAAAKYGHSSS